MFTKNSVLYRVFWITKLENDCLINFFNYKNREES